MVREIEQVERRIRENDRDVTNLEIRLGQLENRWDLRNSLVAAETQLRGHSSASNRRCLRHRDGSRNGQCTE